MQLYLDPTLKSFFATPDTNPHALFDEIMALKGTSFRQQKNRSTLRVRIGQQFYFLKKHEGVGFKEIIKNLIQLRLPVISAKNEWLSLIKLAEIGLNAPLVMAYGERGRNPARKQSFVLMREIESPLSLEQLTQSWAAPSQTPCFVDKQALIAEVARITKNLHQHGINHRDLYICHFLLDQNWDRSLKLFLIDLHRAQIRTQIKRRWQIKDLAALYFSSLDIGLTQRDFLRFMCKYREQPLRQVMKTEKKFWQKVRNRGDKLYRKLSRKY